MDTSIRSYNGFIKNIPMENIHLQLNVLYFTYFFTDFQPLRSILCIYRCNYKETLISRFFLLYSIVSMFYNDSHTHLHIIISMIKLHILSRHKALQNFLNRSWYSVIAIQGQKRHIITETLKCINRKQTNKKVLDTVKHRNLSKYFFA